MVKKIVLWSLWCLLEGTLVILWFVAFAREWTVVAHFAIIGAVFFMIVPFTFLGEDDPRRLADAYGARSHRLE
jgi:hypothetical protein